MTKKYGNDMVIKTYKDEKDCISSIHQAKRDAVHLERIDKNEIVVLFSSNLVSASTANATMKCMDKLLQPDITFEKIDNMNVNTPSEKLMYTSV